MNNVEKINKLKELIANSKRLVILTGAGVSTHSGISDYRSKNGLYASNPETLLSRNYYNECYDAHCKFVRDNFDFTDKEPNDIHKWIANLQNENRDVIVITQNVDDLHEKAGSKNVIHYHGDLKKFTCKDCKKEYDFKYFKHNNYCDCGGKLESSVVLYGDGISEENESKAKNATLKADCMLVIGTSLAVYPFALLIEDSYFVGFPLALINKTEPVNYQHSFDVKIIDDAINVIKEL